MTIEAGTYKCRGIAGSEQYGQTKNNNDQIALELDLIELGQRVTTFLIFSDASAQFSIDRLRALGWEGDDLSNLAGIDRNEALVQIKYEEWEGKPQMRVQILTGVVLQNQMDDKGKRAFAARFKSLASTSSTSRQSPANPPRQQAPNPRGAAPVGDGTDFPFGQNTPQGKVNLG